MHPSTVLYFLAEGPGVDMDTLFLYGALKEGIDTQILLKASPVRSIVTSRGIRHSKELVIGKIILCGSVPGIFILKKTFDRRLPPRLRKYFSPVLRPDVWCGDHKELLSCSTKHINSWSDSFQVDCFYMMFHTSFHSISFHHRFQTNFSDKQKKIKMKRIRWIWESAW